MVSENNLPLLLKDSRLFKCNCYKVYDISIVSCKTTKYYLEKYLSAFLYNHKSLRLQQLTVERRVQCFIQAVKLKMASVQLEMKDSSPEVLFEIIKTKSL